VPEGAFDTGVRRCACGDRLKIIAAVEEPAGIASIVAHLGLPPVRRRAYRRGSFRSSTQPDPSAKRRFCDRIDGGVQPAVA
jgi:hypothetical protein